MSSPRHWRYNRRIVFHLGLFVACCSLAVALRVFIDADTLGDLAAVLLQVGALLTFAGATAVAVIAAARASSAPERIVLRLVPVGLVLVGATFAKTSYANVSIALNDMIAPVDGPRAFVALGPGGRDVRLSGDIAEGVATRLEALLKANPRVERIHLTSDGGLVDEGEALRKVIAAHRLTTFVPDYCVSACTLAFLGGRDRLIMTGARVGFHAPYEEGIFGQTFEAEASAERALYLSAGVAPDFVDQALKVGSDDIWTPDAAQLVAAHVVTGVVDRYRFPDSNLDGAATLANARDIVLRNFPAARKLALSRPQTVDTIATWYLAAYRRGVSEGEVVDGIRFRVDALAQGSPLAVSVVNTPAGGL